MVPARMASGHNETSSGSPEAMTAMLVGSRCSGLRAKPGLVNCTLVMGEASPS